MSGRVQGVFFRARAFSKAVGLRVTGWVRNLSDGRVEAVFEGEEEAVNILLDFCRHGPSGAVVTGVDLKWEKVTDEYADFKVWHR